MLVHSPYPVTTACTRHLLVAAGVNVIDKPVISVKELDVISWPDVLTAWSTLRILPPPGVVHVGTPFVPPLVNTWPAVP